jgi:hypothetical protein
MVQQFLTEMGIHKFALETSSRKSAFETTPTPKNNISKQSEPENVSRSKALCLIFFSCYKDYLEEQKDVQILIIVFSGLNIISTFS